MVPGKNHLNVINNRPFSDIYKKKKSVFTTTQEIKTSPPKNNTPNVGRKTPEGKIVDGKIHQIPGGQGRASDDHNRFRHSRERNKGYAIGTYLQPPPMLFSRDGHAMYMADMYRGRPAFLIGGGPSFADVDKTKLNQPGILTMTINNAVKSFRTDLWVCVDSPTHFIKSVWLDPKITKFVPYAHAEKKIFDNEKWSELDIVVGDCPNVWYYRRNEHFVADQFLFEDTFNWGNHKDYGGGRSVMLVCLRILFYLGVRIVYLLGVDFKMDENTKYHFEQDRTKSSINNNNSTYKKLIERFTQLQPLFLKHEFEIYNCNPDSGLKVFPFKNVDQAMEHATSEMPDIERERTEGLYERTAENKKEAKKPNIVQKKG